MKRTIVLGLAILTLGSTVAAAVESTPRIDQRQERQEWRISNGIEEGSLTRHEASQLNREARQILRLEKMALKDRKLHSAEIGMLNAALNDLSDQIYEAKHNDRFRLSHYQKGKRFRDSGKGHYGWNRHGGTSKHDRRHVTDKRGWDQRAAR